MEIKSVRKLKEGVFIINNNVQISNIDANDLEIICDVKYIEDISKEDAEELTQQFFNEAITEMLKKYNKKE